MASTTKIPRPPGSAHRSPFYKENDENTPHTEPMASRDIFGANSLPEPREALATLEMKQEDALIVEAEQSSTPLNNSISGGFTKEDIEALLAMKMKGQNKFDIKGRNEKMAEYIKRLRACIRSFQELEGSLLQEKDQLHNQLQDEQNNRKLTENMLRSRQDELETGISDLRALCWALEDKNSKLRADNEALVLARKGDAEALERAEKEHCLLRQQISIAQKDRSNANQQVAYLQDVSKRLQECYSSLQVYNNKLQIDAVSMEEATSKLQKEMGESINILKARSTDLEEELKKAKDLVHESLRQKEVFKEEVKVLNSQLQQELEGKKKQITVAESLAKENGQHEESIRKLTTDMDVLKSKFLALEESCSLHLKQIQNLNHQLDIANKKLRMENNSSLQCISEEQIKIEDLQKQLTEAENRIREGEILRKKLHNTILELKGNIRVFCRVRPMLPNEDSPACGFPVLQYPSSIDLLDRGIEIIHSQGQKNTFAFDKVFGPNAKQDDVFVEVSQLIQSALDGYKVCIFAYGQTGSGKTYTMMGDPDVPGKRGVIPRSLEQLFTASQDLSSKGWAFRIQASMLEIYNETIRDLLASNRVNIPSKQHVVRHNEHGDTTVSDLTVVNVTNWTEVSSLLQKASQSRAVGKTGMNEQSSRSHCVFTLRISGFNESMEEHVYGVLNLIDLAGSERLSRSGSIGDRLKETQAINKSLACLGDVIMAIANQEQHIPYRNSKLTYLLQPYLGGDSKMLMFLNISPDSKSVNESLCSLRFAAKVNSCEMNTPRRHIQLRPIANH